MGRNLGLLNTLLQDKTGTHSDARATSRAQQGSGRQRDGGSKKRWKWVLEVGERRELGFNNQDESQRIAKAKRDRDPETLASGEESGVGSGGCAGGGRRGRGGCRGERIEAELHHG
jgi:hypothetical protein